MMPPKLIDSGGARFHKVEWGWAHGSTITPVEDENAARCKVLDNGGRVVCRLKVFPAPLVSAWVDPLVKQPDFPLREGTEEKEEKVGQ